jgi:diguanylate cyclase (GGDEF)-like protein
VLQRLEQGEITGAVRSFNANSLAAANAAVETLDQLITLLKQKSQAAAARAHGVYMFAVLLTMAAVVIAAACAAAVILWTSRNISSPIARVTDAMRRLTAGDDSVTISDDAAREDEVGTLIAAVAAYRRTLIGNRQLAEAAELERQRLQASVSNMPIGLCMSDSSQRLIVCNHAYAEMYRLPAELTRPETALGDILDKQHEVGIFPHRQVAAFKQDIEEIISVGQRASRVLRLKDGRIINTILQPMEFGGWIATHEDVTDRRRAEERIRHMASHDALTDLLNRTSYKEALLAALQSTARGGSAAVLCLDLDRFKWVNDTLGHPAGDDLLKVVAGRLKSCLRESDLAARFGGDEFAVLQVDIDQPSGARALSQRIIDALSLPYDIGGHQVVIGASIGIAVTPIDGRDPDALLRNADLALYRAKSDGRGTYHFFEPEMDANVQARRKMELDLRNALTRGELELFYQPVINLARNEVTCFEALLRWRSPQRGMVSPAQFIPLAEEIGLIVPIGEWVVREACRDAATWPEHVSVAVNLSPVQFRSGHLLETVTAALAATRLPASRLEVEITEGVLLAETQGTLRLLHELRARGVHIAMDDFGTGYSSLSYLRSFPFDRIKIDGSFIRSLCDEASSLAIIRAITGLSASLGMTTTAEGVETAQQLALVRSEGCTDVQGFLFSPPRPAAEAKTLLATLPVRAGAAA